MTSAATLSVRVARKATETADICTLELVAAQEGSPLPGFSAGSHVDVYLPGGLTRQYSLCNDPQGHPPLPDWRAARPSLTWRFAGAA